MLLSDYIIENYAELLRIGSRCKFREFMPDAINNVYIKALRNKTICESNPKSLALTSIFREAGRTFSVRSKRAHKDTVEAYKRYVEAVMYKMTETPESITMNKEFIEFVEANRTESTSDEVVALVIVDDLNYTEIAEKLGVKYNTAKAHVAYAKRKKDVFKNYV